jgi:hypothetical protein
VMMDHMQLTVTEEYPIQAAGKEGMPPRLDAGHEWRGTMRSRCGDCGTRPELIGHVPEGRLSMTGDTMTRNRPLARFVAKISFLASAIAFLAFPAIAQDGTGPAPENAQERRYGGGWECDRGYRVDGAACIKIAIPENAYATGRSYGTGWACRRGYEEVSGTSCDPIRLPNNAFLHSSGYGWDRSAGQCLSDGRDRGPGLDLR